MYRAVSVLQNLFPLVRSLHPDCRHIRHCHCTAECLSDTGCCNIQVEGGRIKIHKKPGWVFGDTALLFQSPRTASIVATTPIELWAMDRRTFHKVLASLWINVFRTPLNVLIDKHTVCCRLTCKLPGWLLCPLAIIEPAAGNPKFCPGVCTMSVTALHICITSRCQILCGASLAAHTWSLGYERGICAVVDRSNAALMLVICICC